MPAWLCAAAHMSALCPPQVSFALMSAPASRSALAASTLPLRAAAMSGVSPSGVRKLGSAPALSSASTTGAEPMIAASVRADVPSWFFSLTFAPALISARTSSRSLFAAAYMMAVLPSAFGAFTFTFALFALSMRMTAAWSPYSAAPGSVISAAAIIDALTSRTAIAAVNLLMPGPLNFGEAFDAVADGFHRNLIALQQREEQFAVTRILRIFQVLAAFDLSVRVSKDRGRQRIVVVAIAVAHVASKENRGLIEHGAAGFFRGLDLLDESGKHLRVVLLNLHQLVHLLRVVAVM